MQNYDTIIIGGGHNGLICAAYLAKSGQQVLLLEAADELGGLAASREFHPGFKASAAHTLNHFSSKVAKDFKLHRYGFDVGSAAMASIGLNSQGEHVSISGVGANATLSGVSTKDADSYRKLRQLLQRFVDALAPSWHKTMPRIGNNSLSDLVTFGQLGLKIRMLGKKDMGEFMRMATLPARDMTDEVLDDPILKAMISWDGLVGSKMAPRSPNATVLSLLYRMSGEQGGAHAIPAGGMEGFVNALASAAKDAGVSIKTGSKVEQITMTANEDGLRASGVLLANGEKVSAANIVSSADPKSTFFKMVGVENLEIEFTNRIKRLRCDGYVAKLHLALKGLPKVNGLDQLDGRMIIAPDMDTIEYAYDEAKYGECSEKPVMEVVIPSLHDASAAPAGQHVLSAHMMYVPYELKGGWTEEAKQACYQRAIDTLAVYMPDIREQIIHGELLTPLDLEHNYNVTGGHWHHTEFAADQMLMMRPTYEAAQYKTPIPGLYLCGAGSHPGGDLMGGPGHNAARELLK